MALITKGDFLDWKQHNVTKAFFDAAQQRIEDAKDVLSFSAGNDVLQDRILVGLIQAYREMQDFYIDDMVETE